MEEIASGKILGATVKAGYFLDNLKINGSPLLIIDILLVSIIFYWVYIFLKETRAMRILYGLFFLLILMALGRLLDLVLLNWILKSLMTMLIVAIPVVFQPELRTALEKLGRTKLIGELAFSKEANAKLLEEVLSAIKVFSERKIGALIVIKKQTGLKEYIDRGIKIDAKVSSEMLQSIFVNKSPLHDGAVIIDGNRIVSASAILPVSSASLSSNLGTRHKAGLGITEVSDAVSIIVSEESGNISIGHSGKLDIKVTEERLRNKLNSLTKL